MAKITVYWKGWKDWLPLVVCYVLAGIDFCVGGFWGLYLLIRIFHRVFGLIGVIFGLILSPITFAIGPLYALIVWKDWLPSVVCYGSTILFIILLHIGSRLGEVRVGDKVARTQGGGA